MCALIPDAEENSGTTKSSGTYQRDIPRGYGRSPRGLFGSRWRSGTGRLGDSSLGIEPVSLRNGTLGFGALGRRRILMCVQRMTEYGTTGESRARVRERAGRWLNSEASGLTRIDADQGEPELYDQPPARLGTQLTFMVKTPSNVRDAPTGHGGVFVQGRGEFRCRSA